MGGWEREEEVKVCVEVDIDVGGVQESTYPGHCLHRNSGTDLWMNGGERENRGKGLEREREERKGGEREGGRANKKKVGR